MSSGGRQVGSESVGDDEWLDRTRQVTGAGAARANPSVKWTPNVPCSMARVRAVGEMDAPLHQWQDSTAV